IGTGINTDPHFGRNAVKVLSALTGIQFESANNKFEGLAAQDDLVELSGQFNALVVALMKIASTVKPGGTLSLQMHHYRAEHWIV
ncbi:hypothetical protein FGX01_03015, partial [Xylella fastidiosa subsp. multiplex]|nr:hypothetical protein [Xylella fastidiosa subsp. multiplex]